MILIYLINYNYLQGRTKLKLISHRRKVEKLGRPTPKIEGLVADTGLSSLLTCSLDKGDRGLLSTFAERWYKKTSSFHLPIGEMSITLDDVPSLLHLPIIGAYHTYDAIDIEQAMELLVELLRVTTQEAVYETEQCREAYVRLAWLRDVYRTKCHARQWRLATKAYLLHLVGFTLFANKSATNISVVFLDAFCNLNQCGGFSCEAVTLVHMYENLNYASLHKAKHLAGNYINFYNCYLFLNLYVLLMFSYSFF